MDYYVIVKYEPVAFRGLGRSLKVCNIIYTYVPLKDVGGHIVLGSLNGVSGSITFISIVFLVMDKTFFDIEK